MDGLTEFAKMLKDRDRKPWLGVQVGRVIKGFPDIEIRLSEFIVLNKNKLLFASSLMSDYEREIDLTGRIQFTDTNVGSTNSVTVGDHGSHSHTVTSISIDTDYTAQGKIGFTSTLEVGDQVIIIPTTNEQKFYVIDKVVTV